MEDQLITFETAVLAKEKGFDEHVNTYINNSGVDEGLLNLQLGIGSSNYNQLKDVELYSVPTQSLLQKWLREVHHISCNIIHKTHSQTYGFNITGKFNEGVQGILKSYDFKNYQTYEEALEEDLQEALKLIK